MEIILILQWQALEEKIGSQVREPGRFQQVKGKEGGVGRAKNKGLLHFDGLTNQKYYDSRCSNLCHNFFNIQNFILIGYCNLEFLYLRFESTGRFACSITSLSSDIMESLYLFALCSIALKKIASWKHDMKKLS